MKTVIVFLIFTTLAYCLRADKSNRDLESTLGTPRKALKKSENVPLLEETDLSTVKSVTRHKGWRRRGGVKLGGAYGRTGKYSIGGYRGAIGDRTNGRGKPTFKPVFRKLKLPKTQSIDGTNK